MTGDGDARLPAPDRDPGPQAGGPGHPGAPILDQSFDAGSLYALRAAVAAHATEAGLAHGRAEDLVIAVHELASNAVRHGAGHGRLRIWRSDQALLCEVSDDGMPQPAGDDGVAQPGDDDGVPRPAGSHGDPAAQWRTEPGHGLSLVRQVADQTSLTSGPDGTLATLSFALGAPGPPFRLDERHLNDFTILAVTGPLDQASAGRLTDAIASLLGRAQAPTPTGLILDLSALTGWDSAGLAALITAQQQISACPPARLVLAGLPGHLAQHLRDNGLHRRFTLADSAAEAAGPLR
jgi:anti-anti-sigma factor